jgi:pantothenate kinase
MGAPDTFDTEGLAHLLGAVQGRVGTVLFPDFDRTIEEPVPDSITVHPDDQVVILEGNYLLVDDENWARIGALLDLCVYVDIPHDVRRERLIRRHISFGKNAEHATEWVERVDEANARVIESTQARAHAIYRPET